jgi:hypothetical protein
MVSVSICGLARSDITRQPPALLLRRALVRQLRDEAANPCSMQRDRDAGGRDIDLLDQQPQDPRLLGGVELVPHGSSALIASITSLSSSSRSSAAPFSRCTAVMVRATSSGDASSPPELARG